MTRRQIFLALLPPLFFGTGFTIAKPAMAHFPPLFTMLMIYGGIAAMLAITHRENLKTPWPSIILISSFAVTLQGALLFWGLGKMSATAANLILQIQIPFAVLLDWLIMKERLNFRKSAGTGLAIVGVAIVIGLPEAAPPLWPSLMIIAGAFCWSLGQVFARKYGRDGGVGMLKANALGSIPQLLIATLVLENGQITSLQTAGFVEWTMLGFVGIVGFYLAYMCWFSLLRSCRMDEVAPFILLMPVVGVLTAYFGLGETISLVQVLGGLVILSGLVIVVGVRLP